MPRKSKVKEQPPDIRARIEALVRQDRWSLDEMVDMLRQEFPAADLPSRSSLGRYQKSVGELLGRMRDIDAAARVVVSELGENPDDRAGTLLTQTITALATNAALRAGEDPEGASIGAVKELARAARNVMEARRIGLKERTEIEAAAEKRLIKEQAKRLDGLQRKGEITPEVLAKIRREVYGL